MTMPGNTLNADLVVSIKDDDLFGRYPLAENLADYVSSWQGNSALVVGVIGDWGSGKSSFIEFMRTALKQKNQTPILDFKPWMFTGDSALLWHFFNFLAEAIKSPLPGKKYSGITKRLENIGEALKLTGGIAMVPQFSIIGDALTKPEQAVKKLQENLDEAKKALEKALTEKETCLIISIDDIDRLTKEEVRQIFQLVKLTANFPHTVYLLAFDEASVADALEPQWGNRFLEKIIQVPVHLPSLSRLSLRDFLFTEVGKAFAAHGFDWPGQLQSDFGVILDKLYKTWPQTRMRVPRDAIRLANALSVSYAAPAVKGNVNVADFLAIEMLRVWENEVYKRIALVRWELVDRSIISEASTDFSERLQTFFPGMSEYHPFLTLLFDVQSNRPGSTGERRIASRTYVHRYFEWNMDTTLDASESETRYAIELLLQDTKEEAEKYFAGLSPLKMRRLLEEIQIAISSLGHDSSMKLALGLLGVSHLAVTENISTAYAFLSPHIVLTHAVYQCLTKASGSAEWKTYLTKAANDLSTLGTLAQYTGLLQQEAAKGTFDEMEEGDLQTVRSSIAARIDEAVASGNFGMIGHPEEALWGWARSHNDWERVRAFLHSLLEGTVEDGRCALELLSHKIYSATDRIIEQIGPNESLLNKIGGVGDLVESLNAFRESHRESLLPHEIEAIDKILIYKVSDTPTS